MTHQLRELMVSCIVIVTAAVPAFAFALAGIAKLHDSTQAEIFILTGLELKGVTFGKMLVYLTASIEIVVAASLCYWVGKSHRPALLALALVCVFGIALLIVSLKHPRSQLTCGCFGSMQRPFGQGTVVGHFIFNAILGLTLLAHFLIVRWRCSNPHGPM